VRAVGWLQIKSFTKPPDLVQTTMEAVCILKGEKPDWDTVSACWSLAHPWSGSPIC
jgi:hypothetical protein